jgi:uncharacterized C2H2 Zn-finger protein
LLKSRGGCCFLVLPKCGDLFRTLYLLNFLTNKSHKVLNQGNLGVTDRQ